MDPRIVAAFFVLALAGSALAAGSISLSPASIAGVVGGTAQISVAATSVTNLYGYQFDVQYDSSVLELNTVQYSNVLGTSSSPQQKFCTPQANWETSTGHVGNLACTRIIAGEINPANGNLATITFNVIGEGSGTITVSDVLVSNSQAQSVSVAITNPSSSFSSCQAQDVVCTSSAQCNDGNLATTDLCLNAGTCNASCSNVSNIDVCAQGEILEQCTCGDGAYSQGY
ncbi:MAG: cohesin domain-containing protein, partial [archaeon]|nr:cohesin domain-containing protein [archaeon]